jgi:hypothetical protein
MSHTEMKCLAPKDLTFVGANAATQSNGDVRLTILADKTCTVLARFALPRIPSRPGCVPTSLAFNYKIVSGALDAAPVATLQRRVYVDNTAVAETTIAVTNALFDATEGNVCRGTSTINTPAALSQASTQTVNLLYTVPLIADSAADCVVDVHGVDVLYVFDTDTTVDEDTKTGDYTLTLADSGKEILVDLAAAAGNVTITLPAAAAALQDALWRVKVSTYHATQQLIIAADAGSNIVGSGYAVAGGGTLTLAAASAPGSYIKIGMTLAANAEYIVHSAYGTWA